MHIFLPLHLTLERGYDFIHAAAIEVDSSPVLFIAPSNGGKSTLADYFLKQGHALLSDDKVATFFYEGVFWAAPSPRLRSMTLQPINIKQSKPAHIDPKVLERIVMRHLARFPE